MAFPDTALANQWGLDTDAPTFIAPSTMNARVDAQLNALAAALHKAGAQDLLTLTPASGFTTPASGTTIVTWVTIGSVTVPVWATSARVTVSAVCVSASAALQVPINPNIGGVVGPSRRISTPTAGRFCWTAIYQMTGLSSGSKTVTLGASFIQGTLLADASSTIDVAFDWLP